ncbi:helix-turn-helix transcriptional regulator [Lentzea tibetensis]|nr:AAA family ATPase [Lentzea tibetensis]
MLGRADDLAALNRLITHHALLTVTGPPGVGKTRAVQALVERRQHVAFIDLTTTHSARDVVDAICNSAHLPALRLESLTTALNRNPHLIVLDSPERILSPCVQVARTLLQSCPRVKIVVASRERLGLPQEKTYLLRSLQPDDAARLFTDRTHQLGIDPHAQESPARLRLLCDRLGGLPLALELAARLRRVLSVAEILSSLDTGIALLEGAPRDAPPRHQSLHAAIDWSYRSLSADEKSAVHAIAVMPGGVSRELFGLVQPAMSWQVVQSLAAKSLLTPGRTDDRCRMPASVRAFTTVVLQNTGELAAAIESLRTGLVTMATAADSIDTRTTWHAEQANLFQALTLTPPRTKDWRALASALVRGLVGELGDQLTSRCAARGATTDPTIWQDTRATKVATLIAEGLTNREISARLHVSLRTAEQCVHRLKAELGLRSRAQIAAEVSRLGVGAGGFLRPGRADR